MQRHTLIDFFDDRIRSPAAFVTHDDGYRAHTHSYDEIRAAALAFARRLAGAGTVPGGKVVVWGENCPGLDSSAVGLPAGPGRAGADRLQGVTGARGARGGDGRSARRTGSAAA